MKDLSWTSNYIRDGFTQCGYIAPIDRLHGELRFSFRPMLPEEVAAMDMFRSNFEREPAKVIAKVTAVCASKLIAWSEVADGTPIPINEISIKRLRPQVLTKLFNIISGDRASDEDPTTIRDMDQSPVTLESLMESSVSDQLGKS